MTSPKPTFPPGIPPNFPKTNIIWHPSTQPGSVFSPDPDPGTTPGQQDKQDEYLLLYIPGNPGMIGYYRTFLSRLSVLLHEGKGTKRVSVLGISHAGFYTQDGTGDSGVRGIVEEEKNKLGLTDWTSRPRPWTLKQQAEMKAELLGWIGEWYKQHSGGRRLKVLLSAHSMGAWVGMEIVRELRLRDGGGDNLVDRDEEGEGKWERESTVEVLGGAMLFPSIVHIARSKNGRVCTPLLNIHRSVPHLLQLLVCFIFNVLLSASLGKWLLGKVTRLNLPLTSTSPDGTLSTTNDALDTTFDYLTSPGVVEQSLAMAKEEMDIIKEDTWDDEIWGVRGGLQWMLYFGQDDRWVDDEARDRLIEKRGRRYVARMETKVSESTGVDGNIGKRKEVEVVGREVEVRGLDDEWKPQMIICQEGLPHDFCTEHGEIMAEKVAIWIGDIVERSGQQ